MGSLRQTAMTLSASARACRVIRSRPVPDSPTVSGPLDREAAITHCRGERRTRNRQQLPPAIIRDIRPQGASWKPGQHDWATLRRATKVQLQSCSVQLVLSGGRCRPHHGRHLLQEPKHLDDVPAVRVPIYQETSVLGRGDLVGELDRDRASSRRPFWTPHGKKPAIGFRGLARGTGRRRWCPCRNGTEIRSRLRTSRQVSAMRQGLASRSASAASSTTPTMRSPARAASSADAASNQEGAPTETIASMPPPRIVARSSIRSMQRNRRSTLV